MRRIKYKIIVALLIGLMSWLIFSPDTARSFSSGAPAGYCNAPASPGSTCFTCHNSGPAPVSVPGMITANIPAGGYAPGTTYTVTATVTGPGHNRFGFEISPQDLGGNLLGTMNDLGTETTFQQAGTYITHSSNSLLNNDWKSWQFEWTAPVAGTGDVTFYGAFNISNNDGSYTGDTIVLSTATFQEDTGLSAGDITNDASTIQAWTVANTLQLRNVAAGINRVQLIDYTGRICWESEDHFSGLFQPAMQFEIPSSLNKGVYIVSLLSPDQQWNTRIIHIN